MRPHMQHIANTLVKKDLLEKSKNQKTSYSKYRDMANKYIRQGYAKEYLIEELYGEIDRIMADERTSNDPILAQAYHNAKVSSVNAIRVVISELKGDQ